MRAVERAGNTFKRDFKDACEDREEDSDLYLWCAGAGVCEGQVYNGFRSDLVLPYSWAQEFILG